MTTPQKYTIDGEKLTRAEIVDRCADDLRRRLYALSTIDARLRNGCGTWAKLRMPAAAGRARSKARFKNWIVNPAKAPSQAGMR